MVAFLSGLQRFVSATAFLVTCLAAVTNPEVVKRAQKEIDDLVGTTRMPVKDDMQYLPYCRAFVKEV